MPPPLDPSRFQKPLVVASEFSGIGGVDVGFGDAGFTISHQSEILPERQRLLQEYWPDVPLGEDICDVNPTDLGGHVDVLAGTFPCTGLSIAAPHRQGLDDRLSGLYHEYTRLVRAYLELADGTAARWLFLENAPGLLRSRGGRDMAAVVMGLEDLGYGWAYRVVDGRYFGPTDRPSNQRRLRVVMVAHRGGDPRPAWAVLGDREAARQVVGEGAGGGPDAGPRTGAFAVGGDLVRVWRKGARPRVALGKPGYRETWVDDGITNTLTGFDGGLATRQTHLIAQHGRLRTLTLTEWERLSAFPDGWTDGLGFTNGQRFAALGDSFQPTVARWLAERIKQVHYAVPQL